MKVLLITGLPRSGTSALASIAHNLGVPMFPPNGCAKPSADLAHRYPKGNFEDERFRKLVWQVIDGSTRSFPIERTPFMAWQYFNNHWRNDFTATEIGLFDTWYDARVAARLGPDLSRPKVFGVKLPCMMFVMKPLLDYLRMRGAEVGVLFTYRAVSEAAISLAEKRGQQLEPSCPQEWAVAVQSYHSWIRARAWKAALDAGVDTWTFNFHLSLSDPTVPGREICRFACLRFEPSAAYSAISAVDHVA